MSKDQYIQTLRECQLLAQSNHWAATRPKLLALAQSQYADKGVYSMLCEAFSIDIQSTDKDLKIASSAVDQAIKMDPEWGLALRQKSTLAILKENYPEAIALATKAMNCKEPDSTAVYQRARAYAALKDYDRALADDNTYLNSVPMARRNAQIVPGALSLKASVLEKLGRFDEAIAVYRLMKNASYDGGSMNIVRCLRLANRLPEATKEITVLVDKNPKDDEIIFKRAQLEMQAHNLNAALADYSKAIELSPMSRYYNERAKVYDALRKKTEAEADRKSANRTEF